MSRRHGFTLFEMLAVLAIVALFAGVIGFSLVGDNSTIRLESAQRIIIAQVNLARARSASMNTSCRVIICNDPDDDRYLRMIGVIEQNPLNVDGWRAVESGVLLPKGCYFVPEARGVTSSQIFGPGDWTNARSDYSGRSMDLELGFPRTDFADGSDKAANTGDWVYFEFSPTGRPATEDDNKFLAASGRPVPGGSMVLENPLNVRGFVIRRYGTITPISEHRELEP